MAELPVWKQLQSFVGTSEMFNPFSLSLLLILLFTCIQLLTRRRTNKLKVPPSPPRLPFIGNLHQLLARTLPHRSLKALADRYGPLMYVYFGNSPTLVVSSAELARQVMKTHDIIFSNRHQTTATNILFYECQDVAFSSYGEYWRKVRKICVLELLSVKRVQSFHRVRDEEVSSLINKIRRSCSNEGAVNLTEMLIVVSNNTISRCVLGRKFDEENGKSKFGELLKTMVEQLTAFCMRDIFPSLGLFDHLSGLIGRLNATARALDAFLDEVIEEHMVYERDDDQSDEKDFVDILLHLQKDGKLGAELTRDNLKAILLDMFAGGTDTTATTILWTLAELVKNPTSMKRAQEEVRSVVKGKLNLDMKDIDKMDYLKCVINETLRLHPPVPLLVPRETTASVKLGDYDIPAKTRVIVNAWAIQRDPQVWDRAEEFLPQRFLNNPVDCNGQYFQFIPFGAGRRGCPGMSFGLASVENVMANLLYWFDWKLAGGEVGENLDMTEVNGMVIHKKLPLHLVPTSYTP